LNDEILPPGSEGWLQLRLDEHLAISRGDRYIVRYPSPAETIGGGVVVGPHPRRRWKRFNKQIIGQLETLMQGTPGQRIAQAAEGKEPATLAQLQKQVGYSATEFQDAIEEALTEDLLVELSQGLFMAMTSYTTLQHTIVDLLTAFHAAEPLRLGMPREEVRSRVGVKNQTLMLVITALQDQIVVEDNLLRLTVHTVRFTERQEAQINELMHEMQAAQYTPPSYADAVQIVGERVLRALIDLGDIVQVKPEVIFTHPVYEEMVESVLSIIDRTGAIDAKGLRDQFNTSRKYAIGLLEHLDSIGVTRRVGDERVKGKNAPH
jgi:selenocysteine-specific elongation factor